MENAALELTNRSGSGGSGGYGDGYGGYGYGYGGYGAGSGGYGDGGCGAGDGDGGYGDGAGSGDGSGGYGGYGAGAGSGGYGGYGDGGYGAGDGDGAGDYLAQLLAPHISDQSSPGVVAFWRCNSDGTPANGGTKTKASVGLVEEINGPLAICTANALHGTADPRQWKGSHWWVVALHGEVQRKEDKFAALKRTFLVNLGKCPFK